MRSLVFLALFTTLIACSENEKTNEATGEKPTLTLAEKKQNRETLLAKINANNMALSNSFNPDSLIFICNGQTKLCAEFVAQYPTDADAPAVLSFQAKAYRVLQQPEKAVESYNRLLMSYSDYSETPEILLIKGLLLDQEIKNKQEAEKTYLELIQKFPNHRFAKDAQALLTQLHMTDEELIKSFEAKNKKK